MAISQYFEWLVSFGQGRLDCFAALAMTNQEVRRSLHHERYVAHFGIHMGEPAASCSLALKGRKLSVWTSH